VVVASHASLVLGGDRRIFGGKEKKTEVKL